MQIFPGWCESVKLLVRVLGVGDCPWIHFWMCEALDGAVSVEGI